MQTGSITFFKRLAEFSNQFERVLILSGSTLLFGTSNLLRAIVENKWAEHYKVIH